MVRYMAVRAMPNVPKEAPTAIPAIDPVVKDEFVSEKSVASVSFGISESVEFETRPVGRVEPAGG